MCHFQHLTLRDSCVLMCARIGTIIMGEIANLDGLLAFGERWSHFAMHECGSVPPSLLLSIQDGNFAYHTNEGFKNGADKDKFEENIRIICMAYNPTAIITILESWIKPYENDTTPTKKKPVSKALGRREVVSLLAESRKEIKLNVLPIIRGDNGKFLGFGEAATLDDPKGRFTQGLSKKIPVLTSQDIIIMKDALKNRGVEIFQLQSGSEK